MTSTMQEKTFPATAMPDQGWWQALWPDPDAVIQALEIKPGMTVVDLCCGDGYFTAAIARRIGAGRVLGFDIDPVMLDRAKVACRGLTRCAWATGDARELSRLIEDRADYVLIANTFHGVPEPAALAREVASVLNPAGRFAIVNWYPRPREETMVLGQPRGPPTEMRMSPEQVCAVIEPAGFKLDKLIELPPYHYGAVFVKTRGA